jgi:penicillin-binding protein 1A
MVRQKFSKEDNSLINYDLYRDGLVIHTSVNSRIQKYANEAVSEHLDEFQKVFNKSWSWKNNSKLLYSLINKAINSRADYKAAKADRKKQIESRLRNDKSFIDSVKNAATTIQTGLVVINPQTGEILAMVGASSKFMRENPDAKYSLNHASQIRRQAGSAFKPLVYALALEKGLTPSSMIECGPYSYTNPETGEVWSPAGGGCENGEMITLYDALRKSINAVAARLITQVVTPREVVELARKLGIQSKLSAVPAIALGAGGEVSPLEMVSAFGAFSFNGYHVNSYYITEVEDKFGNIVFQKKKTARINDALNRGTSQTLTRMLEGVISGGTAWRIKNYFNGISAAGKTGTTNDNADAWFIGYTPELVAGCWVGFDDLRIKLGGYGEGGKAAAPVWGRLMSKIYSDQILPYKQKRFDYQIISEQDSLIHQTFISEEKWDETYNIKNNPQKKENRDAQSPNFPKLPRNDDNNNK